MSSGRFDSPKPMWIKLTQRRVELVVISRIHYTVTHFDTRARRSHRCADHGCAMCAWGLPKVVRGAALTVGQDGREYIIEFRKRHDDLLRKIECDYGSIIGVRIVARKAGPAGNSAVEYHALCREAVVERDITALAARFYEPAILLGTARHKASDDDVPLHHPEDLIS